MPALSTTKTNNSNSYLRMRGPRYKVQDLPRLNVKVAQSHASTSTCISLSAQPGPALIKTMDVFSLCSQYYYTEGRLVKPGSCVDDADTQHGECLFESLVVSQPQKVESLIKLTSRALYLTSSSGSSSCRVVLPISDILGCHIATTNASKTPDRSVVSIIAMVRACRSLPRQSNEPFIARRRLEQSFLFTGPESERVAEEFCSKLNEQCATVCVGDGDMPGRRFTKQLLVIINPKSGSGRSLTRFQSNVRPLLEAANVPFDTLPTQYAGHARDFVTSCDLKNYCGIVTLGGDGILFEVINALMSRDDWQMARKTPVGVLPSGSGNALATALAYAADECFRGDLLNTDVYILCKHQILPFDLILFQTAQRFLFGFLEFSWGFVADVDIESESLRLLGHLRFHIYGVHRVLFKRTRRARLTYLPYDENDADADAADSEMTDRHQLHHLPPLDQPIPADDQRWKVLETDFFSITIQNRSFLTSESYKYPELRRFDPGFMIALILQDGVRRIDVLKQLVADGVVQSPFIETIKMKAFRFEPLDSSPSLLVVDGERIEYGPVQAEVVPRAGRLLGLSKDTYTVESENS